MLLPSPCLLRASESRERTYDHGAYGHHERGSSSSSFDRQRHYDAEYYRDPRDRTLSGGGSGSASSSSASTGGASLVVTGGSGGTGSSNGAVVGNSASTAGTGSGGSTSGVVSFYGSRSRSPGRFEPTETRYEARPRESYTLASVVHRDLYREERGRRGDAYRPSRSRSPHTSQSHNVSPQRLASSAARPPHSPSGSGSRSRSSSSDSASSSSSSGSGRSVKITVGLRLVFIKTLHL